MVELELTLEEQLIFAEILEACISDFRMEIAGTDRLDFRDNLKVRKQVLIKILGSIELPIPA